MHAIQRVPAGGPEDAHVRGRALAAPGASSQSKDVGTQLRLPIGNGCQVLVTAAAEDPVAEHAPEVARAGSSVKPGLLSGLAIIADDA